MMGDELNDWNNSDILEELSSLFLFNVELCFVGIKNKSHWLFKNIYIFYNENVNGQWWSYRIRGSGRQTVSVEAWIGGLGLSLMLFTYTIIKKKLWTKIKADVSLIYLRMCIYVESQYTNANQRLNGHISNALSPPFRVRVWGWYDSHLTQCSLAILLHSSRQGYKV